MSDLFDLFTKKTQLKEVTLFPGSFNPWHQGHEACLELASHYPNIVIIPDFNPQKEIHDEKISIKSSYPIFEDFYHAKKINPTSSWLPNIKNLSPHLTINLIMGLDSFHHFFSWIEPELVLQNVDRILVVQRDCAEDQIDSISQKMKQTNPNLEILFLGNHDFQHLSSTKLRR